MLSVISKAITKLKPAGSAAAGDVKSGKTFYNTTTKEIRTGTFAAQSKTVTAGTSDVSVSPDSGKYLSSVTVQPTPSQSKTATPLLSTQTISPDDGKYLSSVTVNAIKYGNSQSSNGVIDLGATRAGRYYAVAVNGSGTVQGSNNNSSWTTIATVTAAGSSSSAQGGHTSGTGTATYRYFRFNFTGYNNGWSSGCYFFVTG